MTQELFHIYGWGFAQWRKAISYWNLCHPEAPFKRVVSQLPMDIMSGNDDEWVAVQDYWKKHRNDEPNEVQLILPGEQGWS